LSATYQLLLVSIRSRISHHHRSTATNGNKCAPWAMQAYMVAEPWNTRAIKGNEGIGFTFAQGKEIYGTSRPTAWDGRLHPKPIVPWSRQ